MTIQVKCPHCGGQSFTLFERLELAHMFCVEEGEVRPMMRSEGFPTRLGFSAECSCGHVWVPRTKTAYAIMEAERGA